MEILARAVGRRKEAVAQVQMIRGTGQFIINTKPAQEYLQNDSCSILEVQAPFEMLQKSNLTIGGSDTMDTIVKVKGGGLKGQAEAIRLGISRAICLLDTMASAKSATTNLQDNISTTQEHTNTDGVTNVKLGHSSAVRKQLKDKGYLTQDSRVKERRKYGLKKARKASQYHKR